MERQNSLRPSENATSRHWNDTLAHENAVTCQCLAEQAVTATINPWCSTPKGELCHRHLRRSYETLPPGVKPRAPGVRPTFSCYSMKTNHRDTECLPGADTVLSFMCVTSCALPGTPRWVCDHLHFTDVMLEHRSVTPPQVTVRSGGGFCLHSQMLLRICWVAVSA